MPAPQRPFRPPWSSGDLQPRPILSVVLCVTLPMIAGLAGLFGRYGAEVVAVGAAWMFVMVVLWSVPTLNVSDHAITLRDGKKVVSGGDLHAATVSELVPLDAAATARVLASGQFDRSGVDITPFLAVPAELPGDADDAVTAFVVRAGAGRARGHTLLPVWRPEDAVPLARVIADRTPRLRADEVAADLPAVTPPQRPSWLTVAAEVRGRSTASVLAAAGAVAVVLLLSLVARAATLDPILGSHVGTLVVAGFRLLELAALTAGAATATVAVIALMAWEREGERISVRGALHLGALRSLWALWQLRVWLIGTAALLAATGVTGRRVALAYACVTVAIPGTQLIRELARRTVEEARRARPPAMERVAVAHQWVTVAAALVAYLLFRIL